MSPRVLVTARHFDQSPEAAEALRQAGCEIVKSKYGGPLGDTDLAGLELTELLREVDGAVAGNAAFTREVIAASPKLKIIARRGVGYDRVDVKAATDHGVLVTIAAGAPDDAVADHAFALMLAVSRRVLDCHRTVVEGRWDAVIGFEIWRKTLGIVGLGRIGKAIARRAAGFEMKILAYDAVQDPEFAQRYGVTYVSLEELMTAADVVSISASFTPQTYHLVSRQHLQRMKGTAILVNTARGPLIDEQALIELLSERKIFGAGLDVFESEPPGDTPLARLSNVVLAPHSGLYTVEGIERANTHAVQSVISVLQGKLPQTGLLNPDAHGK